MNEEIRAAIAEMTHVGVGDSKRVALAADIGNSGIDEIDWIFKNAGQVRKITLPRPAFTYIREQPMVNFWLVEMDERIAGLFGIEDLVLSEGEAAEHRERILATNNTN